VLTSTLDYERTLHAVARLATPVLGDFCIVDVVESDGRVQRVAAVHADPEAQAVLDELWKNYTPEQGSRQPARRVIESGEPELLPVVDSDVIAGHTQDPRHAMLIRQLNVRSHLAVPIRAASEILGVISLGYVGDRRYSETDVAFAQALASRAAIAIENARLYAEAERASAAAAVANRAKDQFIAVLSHELRNPMAPIVTSLELLRLKHGAGRELDVLDRQIRHMRRLVDDLLDVSRIARGKLEIDLHEMDLAEAVRQSVELVRPQMQQRHHVLDVDASDGGMKVAGDLERLVQVFANLLSNAARYTEPGGTISVKAGVEEAQAVVTVSDNGMGIPADMLPRIFEPFVQGEQSIDRRLGGLGLGLAIVRAILEAHGGTVSASSSGPGRGSVFEVRLPLA